VSKSDDDRLVEAVRTVAPSGARLLNVPAGNGVMSARLREEGYEVVSADLFPEHCVIEGDVPVEADMNEPLPFEEGSFDGVVSQEGVEHLEDLAGFLRECRRVLRPGGHLWVTTPNYMDLSSRLAFLLSGQKAWRAGLPNEQSTLWGRDGDRVYHGHAFTLPWFQLRYLLRVAGFDGIDLEARGWSLSSCVMYPFFRPLAGLLLGRGLKARQARDRRKGKPAVDDALRAALHRDGVSRALLCGKGLLARARAS
jgi:SAM-dependent methyltransferase